MERRFRKITWVAGVLVGLVLLSFIAGRLPGQLDFTEEQIFTLSPASREIVTALEEPMTLRLYFSRGIEDVPNWLKNYATRVEDLLGQFAAASAGQVSVEIIEPEPFSETEEQAMRAGIQNFRLQSGETLFFGLQAIYADQEETITFPPDRERFLEYDIAELIHQTQELEPPVVGILTDLPMAGTPPSPMMMAQSAPSWLVLRELRRNYDVRMLSGSEIPEEVSVLLVLGLQAPDESQRYAIDQFLVSGKPVIAAVDPSGFVLRSMSQNPMMGGASSGASSLGGLLEHYGIDFAADIVVGSQVAALQVPSGAQRRPVTYPFYLQVGDFDDDVAATSGLGAVQFLEPGHVGVLAGSTLSYQPLMTLKEGVGTVDSTQFFGATLNDAERLAGAFSPGGQVQTLAAIFQGEFSTAFPDGDPTVGSDETDVDGDAEDAEVASEEQDGPLHALGESTLVVIADTDFLADPLVGREINFLGETLLELNSDNLPFVLNLVDRLAGSPELIALRGKGVNRRPFDRVDRIRAEADAESLAEIEALRTRESEVRQELSRLESEASQDGRLLGGAAVQEARQEILNEIADVQAQIRRIESATRDRIRGLKMGFASLNIVMVPLLVGIGGAAYLLRRSRRKD